MINGKAAIIRTERGLTIGGTRITIYDVGLLFMMY